MSMRALGSRLPRTAIAWLLTLSMLLGYVPGVFVLPAQATAGENGVSFTSDTDQLAMEQEFDAVPLSFEATVKLPAGYTDRGGVIAGNWRNGNNYGEFDSTREYVNFEIAANGAPRLFWQESHGTSTWESKGSEYKLDLTFDQVNVATGEYVHLAITYDPDTDTANCYVDGVLKQTLTSGNITPTIPFGPLMVGGDYRNEASTMEKDCKGYAVPHNAQYFKGTIANLSVWSSVLKDTEVKAHYDALCHDDSAVPSAGEALLGSWDLTAPDANGDYADKSPKGNDVYVFEEWIDDIDFAEGDYTMLVMPDPQILMKWQTESWYDYTQWIADNVDDLNVKAVISVGDMVNDNNTTQWNQSVQGVETFEVTDVPWIPMRGNHDPSAEFNTYFPYSKYSEKSWFGGSYEEGKLDYCYWFVTVGDREYMMLYLGWAPSWDVLDWAEEVIKTFPEKNVILSTHAYMNWDNTLLEAGDGGWVGGYTGKSGYGDYTGYPEGVDIWEKLGKYENVVLALGGHIGSTDLACWEDENGAGEMVTSMLVDSQHLDYVAAGLIAVLTFHEDSDTVDVNWYSPVQKAFFRERNQFSITVPHIEPNTSGVDKTDLKIDVLAADTLAAPRYSADSWAVFAEALADAKAVLADAAATQKQVDDAQKALADAEAALKERSGLKFSASAKEYAQFSDKMVMPETIELWMKIPKGYTDRNMAVGGYGSSAYGSSEELYWAIEMNSGGTLRYWEEGVGQLELSKIKFDGTSTNSSPKIMINTGEWILVTIVRDQENKQVRAYINGELAGTSSKVTVSSKNVLSENQGKLTSTPLRLGRDWRDTKKNTDPLIFEGELGELRVWNKDLTAAEIKSNYENGADLSSDALYGCWQMEATSVHPHTFLNMATGKNAANLTIQTVGFKSTVSTTALKAAVDEAKALVEEEYTADSWTALKTALTAAETVLANTSATQKAIDDAQTALEAAMDALVAEQKGLTFSASAKNYAEFSQAMTIPETVEVWFKIPKDYASRGLLFGGYGISGKAKTEIFWGLDFNSGVLNWWEEAANRELYRPIANVTANSGEWMLISVVRDQTAKEIRFYLNGELVYTETSLGSKNYPNENTFDKTTGKTTSIPIRLGRDWREDQNKAALTFEGQIGEIRVYNDDRTAAEIKAGYENDLKAASRKDNSYLSDANLTGAWRLRDLDTEAGELHPYTFANLATGTGAVSALTIKSAGFTNPVAAADKTALQADIAAAKALVESDYTADSWSALKTALTAAETVNANTTANQDAVDKAEDDLEAALAALKVAERKGLQFEAASGEYAEFTANMTFPETVSAWVKIPANSAKREMIIGSYGRPDTSKIIGWGLEANASGYLRWWEEGLNDAEMRYAIFDGSKSDNAIKLNDGQWKYITIVRDQENKEVRAYINGELAGTTKNVYFSGTTGADVMAATTGKTTNVPPRFGKDYREEVNNAPLSLNAEIGEVRIWTDDRTAAEIKADYDNDCKPASLRSRSYLSDDNLYGAWQLRELAENESHPYTFPNLSTGADAATALGVRTDGFSNPAGTVFVDGLTFSAAAKNYAQFTACTKIPETVELWVKIPKGYTGREMIVGGYGVSGKGQTEIFWSVEMNASAGTLRWWEEGTYKEMNLATFSNVKINTGEWILISIVRDQENKLVRAYINGEPAGTTDKIYSKVGGENVFDYTTGKMTTDPPRLGRDWREQSEGAAKTLSFEGQIGEIRIYTDDRTAAEIKAGYENDILADDKQSDTYLSDANLYGAWRLKDPASAGDHPVVFPNLATGTAASKDLGIRTVGFIQAESDVAPDYSADYTATGISFSNPTNQMRAEKQFDAPVRTISALVNVPAGSAGGAVFSNYMSNIGGYSSTRSWLGMDINSSGQPKLTMRVGSGTSVTYTADTVDVRGKGWVLVTCVFDDECDIVRWFIDGKRVETITGATATNPVRYEAMKFGGDNTFSLVSNSANYSNYNTNYFKGQIAYVSAWSTVRKNSEILAEAQALQANSANVPTAGEGLMGSWSFAGSGDVLKTVYADKSGNGNDAVPYARFLNDYDADYLKANNISTEMAEGDYSILLMPDIQNITRDHMGGYSAYLDDYMQWIVDNQEKYNILAYVSMGDLVQDDAKTNSSGEWNNVGNAFPILEQAGIPGVPMRGNHDGSGFFSQFIDYDHYASQPWFGDTFDEGYLDNCYWYIDAGERQYLVFSLGWSTAGDAIATGNPNGRTEQEIGKNTELMEWVNEVIEAHPNHNVILTAHNGMSWTTAYTANGQSLYDNILSKHDNIVLASYGHIDERIVVNRTDKRSDGVEFPSLLVDGQGIDQYEGCHAFVCLLTFKNDSDEAFLNWYSVREGSLYRVDGQYSITIPHVEGLDLAGLKAAVNATEALNKADYTTSSWAAVEAELTAAKAVLADKAAQQTAVDAAEKALEDAVAALVRSANKTALDAAIAAAEALAEGEYTASSWAAMEAKLTAAKAVQADGDAQQTAVDAAEKALKDAVAALVRSANKTALNAAIAAAEALAEEDYTTASWAAMEAKLTAAKAVQAEEDAQQTAVDAAEKALTDAVAALVKRADKTALNAAIAAAEALAEEDYTTASWAAMEAKLTAAKAVQAEEDAQQTAVDAAKETLEAAVAALVKRADKTALNAAIAAAEALVEEDYTTASWAAMETALTAAKAVQAEEDAQQAAVDAAKETLEDAVAALVKRADKTALNAAIAAAEALAKEDYTTASWGAMETALTAAKTVQAEEDAQQAAVDAAEKALEDAVAALVKRADKSALQAAIDSTAELKKGRYTRKSWKALEEVLTAAQAVIDDVDAVQDATDAAEEAVLAAVEGLRKAKDDEEEVTYYNVKIEEIEGVEISVDDNYAAPGQTITVTIEADEDMEVIISDSKGEIETTVDGDEYTFVMPADTVIVTVKAASGDDSDDHDCPAEKFADVSKDAWYHNAVDYVVKMGIMQGTGANTFAPESTVSRAMVVTTLYSLAGKPDVSDVEITFNDVAEGDWYAAPVAWAAENGIVAGYDDGSFRPNAPVTREQLATILYANAKNKGMGFTGAWMFRLEYKDVADISSWAYEPVCWMTMKGIMAGKNDAMLDPAGETRRSELAQILTNFCKVIQ